MKKRFDDAFVAAKNGQYDLIPTDLRVRYYATWKKIRCEYGGVGLTNLDPTTKHYWFVGVAGSGKSRCARENFSNFFLKNACNKWWDGYDGEENVIIDDFDKKHGDYMSYYLKIWADIYPFNAEVKGSNTGCIRPKCVVVTSNWSPSEIWSDDKDLQPILRRFRVTTFPLPLHLVFQK